MSVGGVVAFWGLSVLLALTPGADWAYAITAGLRHRSVVPAVGGLLSGHLLATVVVAAGVAVLVARSPMVLVVLTVAGALYLVWLGAVTFARPAIVHVAEVGPTGSRLRQVVTGFGISGLNPKVFLLFLALLPQFTDSSARWPVAAQILVLGGLHVATCAVIYLAVGVGARVVLAARPRLARVVSRCSGAAMVVLGVVLVVEQLVG